MNLVIIPKIGVYTIPDGARDFWFEDVFVFVDDFIDKRRFSVWCCNCWIIVFCLRNLTQGLWVLI